MYSHLFLEQTYLEGFLAQQSRDFIVAIKHSIMKYIVIPNKNFFTFTSTGVTITVWNTRGALLLCGTQRSQYICVGY